MSSFIPSGPITATVDGQIISGRAFSGSGIQITIPPGLTGVVVEDCDLVSTGSHCISNQGTGTIVRHNRLHDSYSGVLIYAVTNTQVVKNIFDTVNLGGQFDGHAINNIYSVGPTLIDDNYFVGINYPSDVVSNFQTSRVTKTNNEYDVDIAEPSGAAFTMGDGLEPVNRGRDNYIARNRVSQSRGVPCGVFGWRPPAALVVELSDLLAGGPP